MFCNTFAISAKTTLHDIHVEACKFWGLQPSEFSLWLESPGYPDNVNIVAEEEMSWKTNALPDLQANEGEKAIIMMEVDPGQPLGQYQTFYLGRVFDAVDKKGGGGNDSARSKAHALQQLEKLGVKVDEEENEDDESRQELLEPTAAVAGIDPFDGLTETANFRTKMQAKRKYDLEMFEIEQHRRNEKLKFTSAAGGGGNKKEDGDEAQNKKSKTTIEFLQTYKKSYIDSLVRLKTEKDAREQKMSSHCCRVFANVCMLLVLLIWIPLVSNS